MNEQDLTRPVLAGLRPALTLLGTLALAVLALPALGGEPAAVTLDPATEAVEVTPLEGVVVAIDPKTGRLRQPSAEELKALGQSLRMQLRRVPESMRFKESANGMLSMIVADLELSTSLARIEGDGRVVEACFDQPEEAARFLAPALLEEK